MTSATSGSMRRPGLPMVAIGLQALKLSFLCLALIAALPIAVALFLPRKPSGSSG